MKITAGLGSIDDYPAFAEAGVDEIFCGYIPEWWTSKYGIFSPLNRREVLYYNVQIGSQSEMEILHEMEEKYHIPIVITLNALFYRPEQYVLLERYIQECLKLGFDSFIIADFALLVYLKKIDMNQKIQLYISGELSEMNPGTMDLLQDFHIQRIIFHRKMTIKEMKLCTAGRSIGFEAFALNEKCHFHGGFCNSLHCDELTHMCKVPYILGNISKASESQHDAASLITQALTLQNSIIENSTSITSDSLDSLTQNSCSQLYQDHYSERYIPGISGCSFCALRDLRDAGITYLKIVGRGNYSDEMIEDIKSMRQAISIMENSASKEEYILKMKESIFPDGCSGNCYY